MAARNVSYVRPAEPAFLRRFKERIGHQEGPTVDTKRQVQVEKDEDREDREDEKPQVVVLAAGDLTQEEAQQAQIEKQGAKDPEVATDGRILFRKPSKRVSGAEEGAGIKANTGSKRQRLATEASRKGELSADMNLKLKECGEQGKAIVKRNVSLLSFVDEDEEES
uniref:uncharacterized protein KIAA1143 homolog isoform X1 n=1 Tax=Myxine glutinosa TaxID=7769 RepID=UPI0035901A85